MNQGLDYNTSRSHLAMPEYGREVQKMVEKAITIPDRQARQHYAEGIIGVMRIIAQQSRANKELEHKLWDHLALMSDFKLDIDYPYDISQVEEVKKKPSPLAYSTKKIPVRHYGALIFRLFDKLKTMPDGHDYDVLVRYTANQMKRMLMSWSHGSAHEEKVADDLAYFTDGRVQLDLETFHFEKIVPAKQNTKKRKK